MNATVRRLNPIIGCGVLAAAVVLTPRYFRNDQSAPVGAGALAGAIVSALVMLIPMFRRRVVAWSAHLDALSDTMRMRTALIVGTVCSLFVACMTALLDRPMQLLWHDEFQFHLQSQMIARFRLWMPAHPLADFFDTFYILISPVYAAQSFPGAALMFVPTVWLHLPTWLLPCVCAGVACALLWWILSSLVDATGATVAMVVLMCSWGFLRVSTMYLAQIPVLLLGLLAFAAMLHWRRSFSPRAAAVVGVALGWAAITRPLDAACYGVIVLIGLVIGAQRDRLRFGPRQALVTSLAILAGAAPFLLLQSALNVRISGSATTSPFAFYNARDQPALAFHGSADTTSLPKTTVPQKQAFYRFATLGFVNMYHDPRMRPAILWRIRLNETQGFLAPALIMLPFAALGMLSLLTRERWLLFAIAPLFVFSYHWYPIYNAHYVVFALPALSLLFALALESTRRMMARWGTSARAVIAVMLVGMSVGAFTVRAMAEPADEMQRDRRDVEQRLKTVEAPAIVLFTAPSRPEEMHTEFVYNDMTAWPDDAPVIRVHDRGPHNGELYRYYAARQPQRVVWRFDRRTETLTRLGRASELARADSAIASPSPSPRD